MVRNTCDPNQPIATIPSPFELPNDDQENDKIDPGAEIEKTTQLEDKKKRLQRLCQQRASAATSTDTHKYLLEGMRKL